MSRLITVCTIQIALLLCIPCLDASASSVQVSGTLSVNTTWNADTVIVNGNLTIAKNAILNIKAGTHVVFTGYYLIKIEGQLLAKGDSANGIYFYRNDTTGYANTYSDGGWQGFQWPAVEDVTESQFSYCRFMHIKNGIAIDLHTGNVALSHCEFYYNKVLMLIRSPGDAPVIDRCIFAFNAPLNQTTYARVIDVYVNRPFMFSQNTFAYNEMPALKIHLSTRTTNATITNCIFWDNKDGEILVTKAVNQMDSGKLWIRNCVIKNGESLVDYNSTCTSGDPLFKDPAGYDFTPSWPNYPQVSTRSSAINKGYHLLPKDPDSTRIDIGAVAFYDPLGIESPVASFTADSVTGYNSNHTVQFDNLSYKGGGPVKWSWDFGDGHTSTLENPSHTYTSTGYFTVKLHVTGQENRVDSLVHQHLIQVYPGTKVPPGNVEGIWEKRYSPYYVYGHLDIPDKKVLTIMPGTKVLFMGRYGIDVQGTLIARGTAEDSIHFDLYDTTGSYLDIPLRQDLGLISENYFHHGWRGIHFDGIAEHNDSSFIEYCRITNVRTGFGSGDNRMSGTVAIYNSSKIALRHNLFYNNISSSIVNSRAGKSYYVSSGISLIQSIPVIRHNTFSHLYTHGGAAIFANFCEGLELTDNCFTECSVVAVYIYNGHLKLLQNNRFHKNNGGVLMLGVFQRPYPYRERTVISDNVFDANNSRYAPALSASAQSNVLITRNKFINNYVDDSNPALYFWGDSLYIVNNLIAGNKTAQRISGGAGGMNITVDNEGIIANNTVVHNTASIYYQTGGIEGSKNIHLFNNVVRYNSEPQVRGVGFYTSYYFTNFDTAYFNNIQGGYPGEGNINVDPQFIDSVLDFSLRTTSPNVDAGSLRRWATYILPQDAAGAPRIDPFRQKIDLGAFELQANFPPSQLIYSGTDQIPLGFKPGSFVGRMKVTDPDPQDTHFFSLDPAIADNRKFFIRNDSIFSAVSFGNTDNEMLIIQVRATDPSGNFIEKDVSIKLLKDYITSISPAAGLPEWITITPNPATTEIVISVTRNINAPCDASVYNAAGIIVKRLAIQYGTRRENIADLPAGVYWLQFQIKNTRYVHQFIKLR